jgi:hypothetical protein
VQRIDHVDATVVAGFLALQAQAGNAAVAFLLQGERLPGSGASTVLPAARPSSSVAGRPSGIHVQRVLKIDGKKVTELPADQPDLAKVTDVEVLAKLRSWATSSFGSHSFDSWRRRSRQPGRRWARARRAGAGEGHADGEGSGDREGRAVRAAEEPSPEGAG